MEPIDQLKFGEIAVLERLVTPSDLREILRLQDKGRRGDGPFRHKIGTIMVRRGMLTRDDAQRVLQIQKAPNPVEGYKILERIGSGGMGTVYRALQLSLRREVALKVLDGRFTENIRYQKRFTREAGLLAMLRHPNLVACFDRGSSGGNLYMAVEYVGGRDLKRILEEDGTLDEKRAIELAIQMTEAMIHYQGHGVLHRDFKPDNILVDEKTGEAKLTDLGLALQVDEPERLTTDGRTLGTPLYISPELAKGHREVDIRSDIYSLGATLYHALTGRPPFTGQSVADIIRKHARDPVPSVREKNPELSKGFARVVDRMLEKLPRKRFQSPEELLEALRAAKRGSGRSQRVARGAGSSGSIRARSGRTPPRGVEPAGAPSFASRSMRSGVTPRRAAASSNGPAIVFAVIGSVAAVLLLIVALSGAMGSGGSGAELAVPNDAAGAFALADTYARRQPSDLDGIATRYAEVAERFPDAIEGKRAVAVLGRLGAREVARLERRVTELLDHGRTREAGASIDTFPASLRHGDVPNRLDQLRQEVQGAERWAADAGH